MGSANVEQVSIVGIAIASIATLAFFVGLILYKWMQYEAYSNGRFASLWVTSSLTATQKNILVKYFHFYNQLPRKSQQIFEFRVARFIELKEFVPRQMVSVNEEMKVLISASAIMLTFGYPKVFLSYFKYIIIFPEEFFSNANQRFHKGEVNPRQKAIVLSWKHFVEGYATREGVNLGIHEMAHALQLENIVQNHEYNFLDEETQELWNQLASEEIQKIRRGETSFFREYAATDHAEFFAVAVENFFERPQEFSAYNYQLYRCLCELLRQDPLLLDKKWD